MLILHNIQIIVLGSYGCSNFSFGYTKFFLLTGVKIAGICDSYLGLHLLGPELSLDFLAWECLLPLFLFTVEQVHTSHQSEPPWHYGSRL
jgi:hypothetical protein